MNGRVGDSRRSHQHRRNCTEPRLFEFAHGSGKGESAGVHALAQSRRGHVHDELASGFYIQERVLLASFRMRTVGAENDCRGRVADAVEKAEWGKVGYTTGADGAYPSD